MDSTFCLESYVKNTRIIINRLFETIRRYWIYNRMCKIGLWWGKRSFGRKIQKFWNGLSTRFVWNRIFIFDDKCFKWILQSSIKIEKILASSTNLGQSLEYAEVFWYLTSILQILWFRKKSFYLWFDVIRFEKCTIRTSSFVPCSWS